MCHPTSWPEEHGAFHFDFEHDFDVTNPTHENEVIDPMTETELIAYALQQRKRGDKIPVTVWRGGRRIELSMPTQ